MDLGQQFEAGKQSQADESSASKTVSRNQRTETGSWPPAVPQTADKRLQELRTLALEYVKQIVVKAGELAQERKTGKLLAGSFTSSQCQLKEAASQINHRLQIHSQQAWDSSSATYQRDISSTEHEAIQTALNYPHHNPRTQESTIQGAPEASQVDGKHTKQKPRLFSKNRINWAFVMSCFSTCLPSTLSETVVSSDTGGRADRDAG